MGFPSDLPNVVVGFQAAISRFVAEANDEPKPFIWLADPNKSIVAVRRGYQVLDSIHQPPDGRRLVPGLGQHGQEGYFRILRAIWRKRR
jgi:hypothetical protein